MMHARHVFDTHLELLGAEFNLWVCHLYRLQSVGLLRQSLLLILEIFNTVCQV